MAGFIKSSALAVVLSLLFLAHPSQAEEYPIGWENYILLDQLSNVPTRKGEVLSASESEIVPVFHIDVPAYKLASVQSKYLDEVTRSLVLTKKNGVPHVRIFFVENEKIPSEKIRNLGYEVASTHWGTKMQSHMTYLVWPKDDPRAEPFFVKMSRQDDHAIHNGMGNARQAIKNNDFVEDVLRQKGNSFVSIFPERFGVGLNQVGINFSNSLRVARPLAAPEGTELTPVHGLMGSKSELEALAKARGLRSGEEWIEKEYLPKLGRYLGDMHFRQGIYLEAHSQNIVLQLNRRTGKIEGIVGRDLNDVLLDPFVHAAQGIPLHFENPNLAPSSLMNYRFVDAELGKYAGPHMGIYPAQSIVDITTDQAARPRYAALFLDAYLKAASRAAREDLPLSENARKALAALRAGTEAPNHAYTADYGEPEGSLMLVAQEIYDRATETRVRRLKEAGLNADHTRLQWTLEHQFWSRFHGESTAFLRPDAIGRLINKKTRLRFEPTEAGILAFDRVTGDPLGLAYDLSPAERKRIEKAKIPLPRWIDGMVRLALKAFSTCVSSYRFL